MVRKEYLGLRGHKLIKCMIFTVVLPGYALLGYNNSVIGGLLSLDSFVKQFPDIDTVSTEGAERAQNARIQGTAVAIYLVGCMFGSLSCYKMGNKLGRIRTIALGAALNIIGSILLCSSFSLGQFIAGRIVVGYGYGCISATIPVWQSESSPAQHRGALVVLEGTFASIGLAASQWIDLGFYFAKSSVSWRFPLAVPILFSGLILCFLPFLPDSPRWLVKVGRLEEARRVMAILEDAPEDSDIVAEDIRKMQRSLEITGQGKFSHLLRNGEDRLLNRTLLAMFSTFSQQANGIGAIGFYTAPIFEEFAGLSSIDARLLSGCTYIWQIIICCVTYFTIDRVGRRSLMMIGATGMGCASAILAGTTSNPDSKACAIIAAACVFLYATFFGLGSLGINFLYGTEVAPLAYRVPIYALTTTTLWSVNFLIVEVSPTAFNSLGYQYFIVFACVNLCLLLPVVYFLLPETRRLGLEDMDAIFRTAKNPFDVVKVAKSMGRRAAHEMNPEEYDNTAGVDETVNLDDLKNSAASNTHSAHIEHAGA